MLTYEIKCKLISVFPNELACRIIIHWTTQWLIYYGMSPSHVIILYIPCYARYLTVAQGDAILPPLIAKQLTVHSRAIRLDVILRIVGLVRLLKGLWWPAVNKHIDMIYKVVTWMFECIKVVISHTIFRGKGVFSLLTKCFLKALKSTTFSENITLLQ